jgi:putative acetyltransferase
LAVRSVYAAGKARLAQLVERFVYTEDVGSSSLSSRTIPQRAKAMITYRLATLADIEEIALLHRHVRLTCFKFMPKPHDHSHEEDLAFFADQIFPRCSVMAASADGRIVGYAAVAPGWLEHLYVHPEWHGHGLGRALLEFARQGQDEMRLWVFQKNTKARRFYERQGFVLEELHDGSSNMEKEPDAVYVWRKS